MANFAELDKNNLVINVVVVDNKRLLDENGIEVEQKGVEFLNNLFKRTNKWVQTSYNNSFRKNFAGIGFTYNYALDAFVPPKLEATQEGEVISFNEETCRWETNRKIDIK